MDEGTRAYLSSANPTTLNGAALLQQHADQRRNDLELYPYTGTRGTSWGCWQDADTVGRLFGDWLPQGEGSGRNWQECAALAARKGKRVFGFEFGSECWITDWSVEEVVGRSKGLDQACANNPSGAIWAVQVYSMDEQNRATLAIWDPEIAAGKRKWSEAGSPSFQVQGPGGRTLTSYGCWQENPNTTNRIAGNWGTYDWDNSLWVNYNTCTEKAAKAGRSVFVQEYGHECYIPHNSEGGDAVWRIIARSAHNRGDCQTNPGGGDLGGQVFSF